MNSEAEQPCSRMYLVREALQFDDLGVTPLRVFRKGKSTRTCGPGFVPTLR